MGKTDQKIVGFSFDDFILDLKNRQLRKAGKPVPLTSKYFDVLVLLIKNRGQLTTKQHIFNEIWSDVIVTDSALSQCIKDIRKQLSDEAKNPQYIKTIPKHGFTFIGTAFELKDEESLEQFSLSISPVRPYKFLDYFQEQDSQIFFGRESEIQIICSKITSHRTFIIHGRSGVGKSSIVRAGLVPVLKQYGQEVFVIRSFTDPVREMANAIRRSLPNQTKSLTQSLQELLIFYSKEVNSNKETIFFLDQFEEFFLLLSEGSQEKFIHTLQEIFSNELIPLKIVFVLREDLLSEMSQLKEIIPEIFHHEYRLLRLNREQAIRAINEPARVVGCPFDEALPQRILNDLSIFNEIDPPQIQIICDSLYDHRDPDQGITIKEYENLGGASNILASYLGRVLNRFNPNELIAAENILKALISSEKEHLVLKTSEIERRIPNNTSYNQKLLTDVTEELIRARIIRSRRENGESWIELMHDFLVPEIVSRITEEESAVMEARALMERAMQNYQAHGLLIDKDSISLILPYSKLMHLNENQTELLARSMLQNKFPLPEWLVKQISSFNILLAEMTQHPDPNVRICAIESTIYRADKKLKENLRKLALWDEDFQVRKSASIILVKLFGVNGIKMLLHKDGGQSASRKRRAISLAFLRDHDKTLIHISRLPISIALFVISGLIWVRILRSKSEIFRHSVGGAIGAGLSGITVGSILGSALAIARHASSFEAVSTILVLLSLGMFAGTFTGFGVSFGMVTMKNITYRHGHWWTVLGGAFGGLIIGGFVNLLGVDTLWALLGQNLSGIAGAFEGFAVGGGTALGTTLVLQFVKHNKLWHRILGAAIGAMGAAILLTLVKGNLFSGSIDIIADAFANSPIKLEPLASLFGEANFGKISKIILGAIEGFLFGGFMIGGIELFRREKNKRQDLGFSI